MSNNVFLDCVPSSTPKSSDVALRQNLTPSLLATAVHIFQQWPERG